MKKLLLASALTLSALSFAQSFAKYKIWSYRGLNYSRVSNAHNLPAQDTLFRVELWL
jgi:hypothetical protein